MTVDEKLELEHRLTALEDRGRSNTKRLNEHDEILKENSDLISSIKELANETMHMREDLNKTISRLDKLEDRDGESWNKFKWLVVTGVASVIIGYLAASLGLQ